MRAAVCALVAAIAVAGAPARARADRSEAAFWKAVQARCDATAAKPASELGQHIARIASDEFSRFGGHRIDSTGRLFHFGQTEAEHDQDNGGGRTAIVGHLGWWQVLKYWRALYGDEIANRLEVLGYRDASAAPDEAQVANRVRSNAAGLLRVAEEVADPATREILREAALRAAIVDTSWSAAFISYVIRQSGVAADSFRFANAHRVYIYDAFAVSAAEVGKTAGNQIYRACPLATTRPRPGDLICHQREPALADLSEQAVRERIRTELGGGSGVRSVRRAHCEVVAHIDAPARKMYTIGGNVNQAVSARKLNLRRDLKFSASRRSHCGAAQWNLPHPAAHTAGPASHAEPCSLNDRKWFVLLQLR